MRGNSNRKDKEMVGLNDRLPILDLSRAYADIRHEVSEALERVFDSQSFILRRKVRTFEEHVKSYLELPEGSRNLLSDASALAIATRCFCPPDKDIG